jgi:hypothetical protein
MSEGGGEQVGALGVQMAESGAVLGLTCNMGETLSHPGFRGKKPGREHNHQVCWDQVSHI